jgi:hypothetical protein
VQYGTDRVISIAFFSLFFLCLHCSVHTNTPVSLFSYFSLRRGSPTFRLLFICAYMHFFFEHNDLTISLVRLSERRGHTYFLTVRLFFRLGWYRSISILAWRASLEFFYIKAAPYPSIALVRAGHVSLASQIAVRIQSKKLQS